MSIISSYIVPHPPIVVPEVGGKQIKKIQQTFDMYQTIAKEIAQQQPDIIIISSPHAITYKDFYTIKQQKKLTGNFHQFRDRSIALEFSVDEVLTENLIKTCTNNDIPLQVEQDDAALDHGTLVPLYFINQVYQGFNIVVLSSSYQSLNKHFQLGKTIQEIGPEEKRVIYIASGDLSHKLKKDGPYGISKEGPVLDERITNIVKSNTLKDLQEIPDDLRRKGAECGLGSFVMMSGAIDSLKFKSTIYSYEKTFGVGYLIASFKGKDPYVELAEKTIHNYIKNKTKITCPPNLEKQLSDANHGVFVTLHKNGRLRGCIGTATNTQPTLADEIIENAISASTKDPRFPPVTKKELPDLEISVDVLQRATKTTKKELNPKHYGIIIKKGFKSGL